MAAERRIVMINAVVPVPGKSFEEAFDFKEVFATWIARMLARRAPGLSSEVCPLCADEGSDRRWSGSLVVSGCNNLVLVVCHLENNRATQRPSNQNKNR